jgi:hypothetical protein
MLPTGHRKKRHVGRDLPQGDTSGAARLATQLRFHFPIVIPHGSRDSSVGIATGYGMDEQGGREFRVPIGSKKIVISPYRPDRLWVHPTSYKNGYQGLFPGVKRQVREADHSPPTSAEVEKMWIYTSTPPYVFMA